MKTKFPSIIFFSLLFASFTSQLKAQQNPSGALLSFELNFSRQVVASGSSSASSNNISLTSTIGQSVVSTLMSEHRILTQGFQQPTPGTSVSAVDLSRNLAFVLFPNPTSDLVTISSDVIDLSTMSVQTFDVEGKLVPLLWAREATRLSASTSQLSPGQYFVVLTPQQERALHTIPFIKAAN